MTTTDALNLYLGENHTSKYYCATITNILKELGRNKKLERILQGKKTGEKFYGYYKF